MANFCHNCGTPLPKGARFCPACGSPIAPDPVISNPTPPEHAKYIPADAPTPPVTPPPMPAQPAHQAPAQPQQPQQQAPQGGYATVIVHYDGNWAAMDCKIRIFVNGNEIGVGSFLNPFEFTATVPAGYVDMKAKMWIRSAKMSLMAEPGRIYHLRLDYNRALGSIKFYLCK